jgi:ABC-2 type transport system permease protein
MKTFLFYLSLLQTSMKASISKRAAFLVECFLMIANNLIFMSIWWIFFRQFNDIAGWHLNEMVLLMAIGIGSYGLMQIFFGGIRDLTKIILSGDLDSYMTQPKSILLHIAGSKSFAKGWGHLFTAIILIAMSEIRTPAHFLLFILSLISGCLVFTSFNIIAHSMAFWLGSLESLTKKYCDALFLFALYPTNIYSGFLQLMMFTLIPAGVITYLPVELIKEFTWINFFLLILSSLLFSLLALIIFHAGLKRYESGNQFGIRS